MKAIRLRQILESARSKRILVIGDLMLDEFIWGKVSRISPEAPVPVVEVTGESFYAGGAANVARNLREFTPHVAVLGMVGEDRNGQTLHRLLAEQQIATDAWIMDQQASTIVKTRVIARQQQVVRVDREQVANPSSAQVKKVIKSVREKLSEIDAIIFQDYGKGFLTQNLVSQIIEDARRADKVVTADPNSRHPIDWKGVTAVKPNLMEAFFAAGIPTNGSQPIESHSALTQAGETLLKQWKAKYLLITLGEDGMMLFQTGKRSHHIPTRARQVFDVSGAGDTAIALFTLALACGATGIEATQIATHGSAVVVGKLGTATVSPDELVRSFGDNSKRMTSASAS